MGIRFVSNRGLLPIYSWAYDPQAAQMQVVEVAAVRR